MIIKELDPFFSEEKFKKSGHAAEKNVAFYLQRYYQNDPTIHVLNGIRLEENNDAAQIDHLLIHATGMIVIECKSVYDKLQLKEDGQWIRWFGNQSKGMGSPIKQAEMQIDFLRKYLNKKLKNSPQFFDHMPIEILVAISNEGQFLPPKNNPKAAPEVCKMDQLKERIDKIRENNKALILSNKNIATLSDYLKKVHKPLIKKPTELKVEEKKKIYEVTSQNKCKHCCSNNLEIAYGKSYYFRCLQCEKNTPINNHCKICNRTEKIRKEKNIFFTECAHCKTSKPFHSNT